MSVDRLCPRVLVRHLLRFVHDPSVAWGPPPGLVVASATANNIVMMIGTSRKTKACECRVIEESLRRIQSPSPEWWVFAQTTRGVATHFVADALMQSRGLDPCAWSVYTEMVDAQPLHHKAHHRLPHSCTTTTTTTSSSSGSSSSIISSSSSISKYNNAFARLQYFRMAMSECTSDVDEEEAPSSYSKFVDHKPHDDDDAPPAGAAAVGVEKEGREVSPNRTKKGRAAD
jgi:hypothetical protein